MAERPVLADERVRLVELVDRVLDRGVVLRGDVTISVAGIDLIYLELRLLLSGVETLERHLADALPGRPAAHRLPGAAGPAAGGSASGGS